MSIELRGYVLEPPRVGQANSPFTSTPDCGSYTAVDRATFGATYGTDESSPGRREYLVLVLSDGDLYEALFGWTRNDSLRRFDYEGKDGRFRPLPGGPRLALGPLSEDANSTRLVVPPPTRPFSEAPYRLSVGSIGSGVTLSLSTVPTEGDFTPSLPSGEVEVALDTGALNWSPSDLTTLTGQPAFFQRQAFFGLTESSGQVGLVGEPSFLTPIPASGQRPLVRLGFGLWLTDVEVPNDSALGTPSAGTFTWSRETGRTRFASGDEISHEGASVYYDGALFARDLSLPRQTLGTAASPSAVVNLPDAGGDVVFRAGSVQFPETLRVPDLTGPLPKAGQVQVAEDGAVRLSVSDVATYGASTLTVLFGDLPIEDGLSFRFYRSPVDPSGTNPDAKDVSAFYSVENSTLADPLIASPFVFLPCLPIDASAYPFVARVEQGTGTFLGVLPRLDVPSPPTGLGCALTLEAPQVDLVRRKEGVVLPFATPTAVVQLPDALVRSQGLVLELDRGSGYVPLVLGEDALLDAQAGSISFVTRVGEQIAEGVASIAGTTLTDLGASFSPQQGDFLVLGSGPSTGVYRVLGGTATTLEVDPPFPSPDSNVPYLVRRGDEVIADRFFREVSLVDPSLVVELVRGSSTIPLTQDKDYRLDAERGLVQLKERLLAGDELRITYVPVGSDGVPLPSRTERATFFVRRETASHPSPGSFATFNPLGREVAQTPAPAVFRGGRPQTSDQVVIDLGSSTITFLPDAQITDALPHGASLGVSERVGIDYYVYQAIGGENTTRVLTPPIRFTSVQLRDGDAFFDAPGDWVSTFPAGFALRVNGEAVYNLAGATFDGIRTRVTLAYGQSIRGDASKPTLHITSGTVYVLPGPGITPYFLLDSGGYDPVPRGMNHVRLSGDRVSSYPAGTLVAFDTGSIVETYLVSGSSFDAVAGKTDLVLTSTTARQYSDPGATLRRSVRPVFEDAVTTVRPSRVPFGDVVVVLFSDGSPGQILLPPAYTLDASGKITLANPLGPGQSLAVFYTGYDVIPSGTVRASYTASFVPSEANGLLGQRLVADFTTFSPDSFYARIETLTNFRAEVEKKYEKEAASGSPSGGPTTSNTSQPKLSKQGAPSIFFEEGDLRNEDIIAREILLVYQTLINALEGALGGYDGRLVGDSDGPFRFDGSITNPPRTSMPAATNQIDDRVRVSPLPAPGGTYLHAYEPSALSRLYPTRRRVVGATAVGEDTGALTDDPVLDLGVKNVLRVHSISRRPPRALVTAAASVGSLVLTVDQTGAGDTAPDGSSLLRPSFAVGMKVFVVGHVASPLTITGMTPTTLSFTPGLASAVPSGATVTLAAEDTIYRKSYRIDFDLGLDPNAGQLLYVEPYPPYDGSDPDVPPSLQIRPPSSGELLDVDLSYLNSATVPEKIPALFGQTLNDDRDQGVPFLNPGVGENIAGEEAIVASILAATQGSLVVTGTLDVSRTTLTLLSGTFPTPLPLRNDLARIRTGANAGSSFVRIVAATSSSITVETPFPLAEPTPVTFVVVVGTPLVSAAPGGPVTHPTSTELDDPSVDFFAAGVEPGQTVILTSNPGEGERRRIVTVGPSSLVVTPAFTSLVGGRGYRVVRSLSTYGGLDALAAPLASLSARLAAEVTSFDQFFTEAFTDLGSSSTGTVSGVTLTASTPFPGSVAGAYVLIDVGANRGIYPVAQQTGPTTLEVDTPGFPTPTTVTFRIATAFGVGKSSIGGLSAARASSESFLAQTQAFASLVTTSIPVLGDAGAYARGVLQTDLTDRAASLASRPAAIASGISSVEATLDSSDRLYDARYAWIDARVNLEKGILPRIARAAVERAKKLEEIRNQLIKLLSVRGLS